MGKLKTVLMGGATLLAMIGTVSAADLAVKAPAAPYTMAVPAGFSWTGIYLGVHGGYEFGANDITARATSPGATPGTTIVDTVSLPNNASGGFGGGHIGWDYQFASVWVFGLRTDIDASGLKGTSTDIPGLTLTREVPWHGDVVARLVYLVTPQTGIYGLGGGAFGEIKDAATGPLPGTITIDTNNVHGGWVAGAGIQHYFTPSLSGAFEWNYTDLGNHGIAIVGPGRTPSTFNTADKAAFNSFKGILSVKF